MAPGRLIVHGIYQPHAVRTAEAPMLALWAWTGNLAFSTYLFVSKE